MIPGLIGKKVGMTRIYHEDGTSSPVTLIECGPCVVTQVKTQDSDGYGAVQLGFDEAAKRKVTKPLQGHFKKAGTALFRNLREFRTDSPDEYKVGDTIKVADIFQENARVKVCGKSKGAGFAGGMKRHGFHGAGASHGQEKVHRRPMSAGSTDAARVFRGKRSPGHMGDARVTTRNLKVLKIDSERNLIAVMGPVPGKKDGLVIIENI
jgi:large subunit ribosomal protein L3